MKQFIKNLMAVLIALSLLMTAVPGFAEATSKTAEDKAALLHDLGLYSGTSEDDFNPDLGSSLTREQGITMLLRVFGLEAEAQKMTDAEVQSALSEFSDMAGTSAWAIKNVAYAVSNNIVTGFPNRTLQASTDMTSNQFAALLLRGLGYQVTSETFSQAASTFAGRTGSSVFSIREFGDAPLLRSSAVDMFFGTLGVPAKGNSETVIQRLVSQGIVQQSDAIDAGLVEPPAVYIPSVPDTDIPVTFSGLVKAPTPTFLMTQLLLSFSNDPATLSISNITVTGAAKGELSGTGTTRFLTISDITVPDGGNITVSISNPSGYVISPSSQTVGVVRLPIFASGAPATFGTELSVTAGLSLDETVYYTWYRSSDTILFDDDTCLGTGKSYTPVEADINKYLIVTATSIATSTVKSTVATAAPVAKAAGSPVLGTISGSFPSAASSINLTGFAASAQGIEYAVAVNGTDFTSYSVSALSVDAAGSAVIGDLHDITTSTKVKVRIKETPSSLAGPEQIFSVTAET